MSAPVQALRYVLFTGLYADLWYMTSWVVFRHYVLFGVAAAR